MLKYAIILALGLAMQAPAKAESASGAPATPPPETPTEPGSAAPATTTSRQEEPKVLKKVVVSTDLDKKRDEIAPSLGAVTYTIGPNQIQTTGQGENATFQQQLLHAPGVVQDEFGQVHVRGDHGDLQYRVNGVLLPEQLNGFGQEIDTRMINSVTLITGSLPAQFGDRTTGIIDITTKTGAQLSGGEISTYNGSYDTNQQSLSYGGTKGKLDYYFTTSFNQNDVGIDNTTSSDQPKHDRTDQEKAFGYFSYILDDTSRLTLLLNASKASFQIPATPGLAPTFALAGNPPANSSAVDETQNEQNYYSVLSYQKSEDKFSMQLSPYIRYTDILFRPDYKQDLLFDGVAARVDNNDLAIGFQADTSFELTDHHTLRGGMNTTIDIEQLKTNSAVFPAAGQFSPADGSSQVQTSNMPFQIANSNVIHGETTGLYVEDEWRLTSALTMNYGLRFDSFAETYDSEEQVSPRLNLVYKINMETTAHAGYARYFTPPSLRYVPPGFGKSFEYTTNAPYSAHDDAPKVERDNYFDAGLSRQITAPWQVTLDGYYKLAKNCLDDGQFGNAVILNNFNYAKATIDGAEFSTTYKQGDLSLYGNFAYSQTAARNIDSMQFEIANDELAYIAGHNIHQDHDQKYTASAGGSYTLKQNTRFYTDFLYGDGLRAGFANTEKLPGYYPVNVGVEHVIHTDSRRKMKLRFDCLNVFNEVYELRNGTGIGIAAPAYGQRRGFYGGISFDW